MPTGRPNHSICSDCGNRTLMNSPIADKAGKLSMRWRLLFWAAVCCLSQSVLFIPMSSQQPAGAASPGPPACLPPPIAKVVISRVEGDATFRLPNGQVARLEGLRWPGTLPKHLVPPETMTVLRALLGGRPVILQAREPKLDRYRRLRVQVILGSGEWMQELLIQKGLALVSIAPDRPECARELYRVEEQARRSRRGLWADPANGVRNPATLGSSDLGTFQIVEGKVLSAKVSGGRAYLNFGENWRTDFTVSIPPDDMKRFKYAGIDPYTFIGKTIRVRGYIDRMNGFEIEADSPADIEEVDSGQSAANESTQR